MSSNLVFAISLGEDPFRFDPVATLAADNLVRTHGLLATLQTHIDDLRSRGPSLASIASKFSGIGDEALHRLLFINGFGSDLYTQEGWRPNAGQGFFQSSSIADNMAVVTHKVQQFARRSRALSYHISLRPLGGRLAPDSPQPLALGSEAKRPVGPPLSRLNERLCGVFLPKQRN